MESSVGKKRCFLAAFRNVGSGKRVSGRSKRVSLREPIHTDVHGHTLEHVNNELADEIVHETNPEEVLRATATEHVNGDTAALHLRTEALQKLVHSHAKTIHVMTESLRREQATVSPIRPPCCQMKLLKKKITVVITQLYLGHYTFSSFYPKEEDVIECIFASFGVEESDMSTREQFLKEWHHGEDDLQGFVNNKLRERRGAITTELRSKFFALLGYPIPLPQASMHEFQDWERFTKECHEDGKWHVGISEDGTEDPLGSTAVHGAVARVVQGLRYDQDAPAAVTISQLSFFLHVMDYALQQKTLRDGHRSTHLARIRFWKQFIEENASLIKHFEIVEPIDLSNEDEWAST